MTSINPGPSSSTSTNTQAQLSATAIVSRSAESFGASPTANGATNTTAINSALAQGGPITLNTPGIYTVACSTPAKTSDGANTYNVALFIGSNTHFSLGLGVILMVAAGTVNPVLIQNSNIAGGNTNIEVSGGTWDGNFANITRTDGVTFCCILRWFQNVANLSVHDSIIQNSKAWADGLAALTNFKFFNLTYVDTNPTRTAADNFGGVNLEGPNTNGYIGNITGNTLDDLVALCADQADHSGSIYINTMAGYGAMSNIRIENLQAAAGGQWHLLRLLDSVANPISNVTVSGIYGNYLDGGCVLGSDTVNSTSALFNITLENGCLSQQNINAGRATVQLSGSFDSVTIRSFKRVMAATDNAPTALVEQITSLNTPASRSLTVTDCEVLQLQGLHGINLVSVTNGTLQNLNISDTRFNSTLNSGAGSSNVLNIAAGTTVNFLKMARTHSLNNVCLVILSGVMTSAVISECNYSGPTSPSVEAIRIRGTVPFLALVGNNINLANGGAGTALGVINFNGSTGTTLISARGNLFNNAANVNIARAGSEVIRFDGLDFPVPNAILTEAVGDVFRDSSNANNPYRCSVAPSTFVAL
jgi:hypothetical protein